MFMDVRDVRSRLCTSPAIVDSRARLYERSVHVEPVLYLVVFSARVVFFFNESQIWFNVANRLASLGRRP